VKSHLRSREDIAFLLCELKFCKNTSAVINVTVSKYECGMLYLSIIEAMNSSLLPVRLSFCVCVFSLECFIYEQFKDFILKIAYNMSIFLIL